MDKKQAAISKGRERVRIPVASCLQQGHIAAANKYLTMPMPLHAAGRFQAKEGSSPCQALAGQHSAQHARTCFCCCNATEFYRAPARGGKRECCCTLYGSKRRCRDECNYRLRWSTIVGTQGPSSCRVICSHPTGRQRGCQQCEWHARAPACIATSAPATAARVVLPVGRRNLVRQPCQHRGRQPQPQQA